MIQSHPFVPSFGNLNACAECGRVDGSHAATTRINGRLRGHDPLMDAIDDAEARDRAGTGLERTARGVPPTPIMPDSSDRVIEMSKAARVSGWYVDRSLVPADDAIAAAMPTWIEFLERNPDATLPNGVGGAIVEFLRKQSDLRAVALQGRLLDANTETVRVIGQLAEAEKNVAALRAGVEKLEGQLADAKSLARNARSQRSFVTTDELVDEVHQTLARAFSPNRQTIIEDAIRVMSDCFEGRGVSQLNPAQCEAVVLLTARAILRREATWTVDRQLARIP